jgi:hypothetical protein
MMLEMWIEWRVIAFGAPNPFGSYYRLFSHRVGCCICLGWCRWTYDVCFRVVGFSFTLMFPWLRATTLLWGGVLIRWYLGQYFLFLSFWPICCFSSGLGRGFFIPTPWCVYQGLGFYQWHSGVTTFLLATCLASTDRASTRITGCPDLMRLQIPGFCQPNSCPTGAPN